MDEISEIKNLVIDQSLLESFSIKPPNVDDIIVQIVKIGQTRVRISVRAHETVKILRHNAKVKT